MIQLDRAALPSAVANYLDRKTEELKELAPGEVETKAAERWRNRSRVQFQRTRAVLRMMCSGNERCMYCEDSAAAHLDHFSPRSIDPLKTFVWDNYLLACSVCNSNYKRDEFPTDDDAQPLLLNPTVDDPQEHLVLSPSTGKYQPVAESPKAFESIRVFGLNRSLLETARRDSWQLLEIMIRAYADALDEGDVNKADQIAKLADRLPHAGVLRGLIEVVDSPYADLVDPRCREACAAHPEILDWGT